MVILGVSTTGPPGRSTARGYRQLPPRCRSGGSFVDGQGAARIADGSLSTVESVVARRCDLTVPQAYGRRMERNQLAHLLDRTDHASSACRTALLCGADFTLWDGTTPASRMVPAYERRQAQTLATGAATLGLDEALDTLREAGVTGVRLAQVNVSDPPYVFMVFLAGDPASVITCFGVSQAARA